MFMSSITFNHNIPIQIDFNISPLLEGFKALRSDALSVKRLYRLYKTLDMVEAYIKYAIVHENDIEAVQEALLIIDDTIDEVEERIEKANIIQKILLKKILSKLLTIQFVLSNKVADYIGENHQDKTI